MKKPQNPRVAILTTLRDFNPSYSLVSVIKDQLVMHHHYGYDVTLFTLEGFTGEVPSYTTIKRVLPAITLEPYKGVTYPPSWKEDAKRVEKILREEAQDFDIIITHDWIFIDTYLPYNIGLRDAKLRAKQFHWIHSAPSVRKEFIDNPHANRYVMPQNSKLVYLNHDKTIHVAEMYGTLPSDVGVVHNSLDPRTFWGFSEFVSGLISKYTLFEADIMSVYPLSSTRMVDGKQVDALIRLHAELKKLGYAVRLIIPNAHANHEKEKKQIVELQAWSKKLGLSHYEVIFTSLEDKQYEIGGIPREYVSELFRLSNVFIFPTYSENCSLVLLEAMASGNFLVLNKMCTGLLEFGGENALYLDFGKEDMGARTTINYTDTTWRDYARIISSMYEQNSALKAKMAAFKRFNLDTVFRSIEKMYYEE